MVAKDTNGNPFVDCSFIDKDGKNVDRGGRFVELNKDGKPRELFTLPEKKKKKAIKNMDWDELFKIVEEKHLIEEGETLRNFGKTNITKKQMIERIECHIAAAVAAEAEQKAYE
jgi:hypothetical protein